MKAIALIVALSLAAGAAYGATVDGKWEGLVKGPDGNPSPISYLFKAKGTIVTGTVAGGGVTLPIRDGKIVGNNISFALDVEYGGRQMMFQYKGVVAPNQIKFIAQIMGQPMEILVKRAR
jgi:hypothetical protein